MGRRASLPDRVTRHEFPPGARGTASVVQLMCDLAREGMQSEVIRTRVRELLSGYAPGDFLGRVAAVWNHLLDHVTYVRNPLGVQHLTTPDRLDAEIDEGTAGECCASLCTYAAALFGAAGIPTVLNIIGWDASKPDRFEHCFLEVFDKRSRQVLPFDVVGGQFYPDQFGIGDTLAFDGLPRKRFTLDGKPALGDIDWQSVARGIVDAGKDIAKGFGPIGKAVADVIQDGENLYDRVTGKPLGKVVPPPPKASSTGKLAAGVGLGFLALKALL